MSRSPSAKAEKRTSILDAAAILVAEHGDGVATAAIARAADISNGSLFVYFPTKSVLMNALFVSLKAEMGAAAAMGAGGEGDLEARARAVWHKWIDWGAANPQKRKAMANLANSPLITPASREESQISMLAFAAIVDDARRRGPLAGAPLLLVLKLVNAAAEATMDYLGSGAALPDDYRDTTFAAVWRMIT